VKRLPARPRLALRGLVLASAAAAIAVQAAEPSPALERRAAELVELFAGRAEPEGLFSPRFLAEVPPARLKAIGAQLRGSYGGPRALARIEAKSGNSGTIFLDFERATVRLDLVVTPAPPHHVEGLLIAGAEMKADSVAAVFGELTALPGEVSLAAARLLETGPDPFLTEQAGRPMAIASGFKLFILAELVRAVEAGERRWSDVVPLAHRSLPSGILQEWPQGAPLTLHSLAALMISRSDNSAADTLLHALGREKVEAILPILGVEAAARNRPFLATREAFALKRGDPALLAAWAAADEAGRRALLPKLAERLDPAAVGVTPAAIGEAEWFASPADMIRTLDWIRRHGDKTALDLLAINNGLGGAAAEPFRYLGYKGGSEPGVIGTNFLLHTRGGRWIALSIVWNDDRQALDDAKFIALVGRLVALMRDDPAPASRP
jgi:hypothetical protein